MGSAADKPMAFIDTAMLAEWRDDRLMRGISPMTIKNQIVFLTSAFCEALAQGVIIDDPFNELTPAKPSREAKIKRPFSKEQFEGLLRTNEGEWRALFLLAFYTGQRDRDCRLLEWPMVDFGRGEIRFKRRKTHDIFTVPMHPRLERHLRWWKHCGRARGLVLPEMAAMDKTAGKPRFARAFRFEILPKIGIEQPYSKGPGRTQSKYSFHSFRHSLSTVLNEAGVSEIDRMALVGHSDRSVNRGYTHTRMEHLRAELAKV